jgi:hypothetical protein
MPTSLLLRWVSVLSGVVARRRARKALARRADAQAGNPEQSERVLPFEIFLDGQRIARQRIVETDCAAMHGGHDLGLALRQPALRPGRRGPGRIVGCG